MDATLLDTDMLNEVLKQKNATVVQHAANYLRQHGQFAISSMTRYEILRGLKEKAATAQLARFAAFCGHTLILPISDSILDRATDLWAEARQIGQAGRDAIGFALVRTRKVPFFRRINANVQSRPCRTAPGFQPGILHQ